MGFSQPVGSLFRLAQLVNALTEAKTHVWVADRLSVGTLHGDHEGVPISGEVPLMEMGVPGTVVWGGNQDCVGWQSHFCNHVMGSLRVACLPAGGFICCYFDLSRSPTETEKTAKQSRSEKIAAGELGLAGFDPFAVVSSPLDGWTNRRWTSLPLSGRRDSVRGCFPSPA